MIAKAVEKTWIEKGYPFKDQNAATIQHLKDNPTDLKQEDIMFFNLPICDMNVILGNKHLNEPAYQPITDYTDRIAFWGLCTCQQQNGWPDDYKYKDVYGLHWPEEECRKEGWGGGD